MTLAIFDQLICPWFRSLTRSHLITIRSEDLMPRDIILTPAEQTGYIVSNADDLLGLFDADFGILVVGEGAKILGPNQYGQEILIIAEYLRMKEFRYASHLSFIQSLINYSMIQASQAVVSDYPDLPLTSGMSVSYLAPSTNELMRSRIGLEVIAGLLYVPLSRKGKDFIAFLRKGQPKHVRWAGKPPKPEQKVTLEPRQSFRTWSEIVAGRCRAWTDTQLETAGVLALVYGKVGCIFLDVASALVDAV